MKRDVRECFERILIFSKKVKERTKNITLDSYLRDELLQESVMYCLGQIGEIASKISQEEQEKYPNVFWDQMVGLRHRLFHDYEEINFSKVYDITQEPIVRLIKELEHILNLTPTP
ncbi:MAG: DUF86 domain-containing protein [Defluviitaleaceae bacterium]|nr:DUF86 domain-containing protein [Defluviitaleaceae bacterium]